MTELEKEIILLYRKLSKNQRDRFSQLVEKSAARQGTTKALPPNMGGDVSSTPH